MTIDSGKLEKSLKKKGFVRQDGDHRFYRFYVAGKATSILTKILHGRAYSLGPDLIRATRRQMGLQTARELVEFVDCKLTQKKYLALLLECGKVHGADN